MLLSKLVSCVSEKSNRDSQREGNRLKISETLGAKRTIQSQPLQLRFARSLQRSWRSESEESLTVELHLIRFQSIVKRHPATPTPLTYNMSLKGTAVSGLFRKAESSCVRVKLHSHRVGESPGRRTASMHLSHLNCCIATAFPLVQPLDGGH